MGAAKELEMPSAWVEELAAQVDGAFQLALQVTGNRELSEECVQEGFRILLGKKRFEWRSREELRGFLFKIVYRSALDANRSLAARRRRERAYVGRKAMIDDEPQRGVERSEMAAHARALMHELPPEERLAIALCCEQGLSQEAAAEILGMHPRAISRRLHVGLETLRRRLGDLGYAVALPALREALAPADHEGAPGTLKRWVERHLKASAAPNAQPGRRLPEKVGWPLAAACAIVAAVGTILALRDEGPGGKEEVPSAEPKSLARTPQSETLFEDFEDEPADDWTPVVWAEGRWQRRATVRPGQTEIVEGPLRAGGRPGSKALRLDASAGGLSGVELNWVAAGRSCILEYDRFIEPRREGATFFNYHGVSQEFPCQLLEPAEEPKRPPAGAWAHYRVERQVQEAPGARRHLEISVYRDGTFERRFRCDAPENRVLFFVEGSAVFLDNIEIRTMQTESRRLP